MSGRFDFYQRVHSKQSDYSGAVYDMATLARSRSIRTWLDQRRGAKIAILDIGCGKGVSLRDTLNELARSQISVRRVIGLDLLQSPGHVFAALPSCFEFMECDLDGKDLPLPTDEFDLVICNHVLEHIFETEHLLREIRRVMAPRGRAIISVPNIAAWINRLLFLAASLPLGSEVGTESVSYGFWPRFLQKWLNAFQPAGHIRAFTPRALRDLCHACGFLEVGWWNQSGWPLFPLTKWAGRNIGIILSVETTK